MVIQSLVRALGRARSHFPRSTNRNFISLQVRGLDAAAAFYEQRLGWPRAPASPPGAVVFATEPIAFAVRELMPTTDLDAGQLGRGVAVWVMVDGAQALHDQLRRKGGVDHDRPFDGPFGRTFAVSDPDGYVITLHDGA